MLLICLCRLAANGAILWSPSLSMGRKPFAASALNLAFLRGAEELLCTAVSMADHTLQSPDCTHLFLVTYLRRHFVTTPKLNLDLFVCLFPRW